MASHRFSLRNLYLYAVCLITLFIAIFSVVALVGNVVELFWPAEVVKDQFASYDPNRENVLDLIRNVVLLLVSVPVYLYHWNRIQEEREVLEP